MPVPAVTINILGDASHLDATLESVNRKLTGLSQQSQGARQSVGGLDKGIGSLVKKLALLAGGFLTVQKAVGLVTQGIRSAGFLETMETQFGVILGGSKAAEARIKELAIVANSTPFANSVIFQMSKGLQALTGDALGAGKGLMSVVDMAAAINPSRALDIANFVGRLHSEMKSLGKVNGEALRSLMQMGAVSGDLVIKLKEMQEAGADGEALWAEFANTMGNFEGASLKLSRTFDGIVSTVQGKFTNLLGITFQPINKQLTELLSRVADQIDVITPKWIEMGKRVAEAIQNVILAFDAGRLGELISLSFKVGVGRAWDQVKENFAKWGDFLEAIVTDAVSSDGVTAGLSEKLKELGPLLRPILELAAEGLVGRFRLLTSKEFWAGLFSVLQSVTNAWAGSGQVLWGKMLQGSADFISKFGSQFLGVGAKFTISMLKGTGEFVTLFTNGMNNIIQIMAKLGKFLGFDTEGLAAMVSGISTKIQDGVKAGVQKIETGFSTEGMEKTIKDNLNAAGKALEEAGQDKITKAGQHAIDAMKELGAAVTSNVALPLMEKFKGVGQAIADVFGSQDLNEDKLWELIQELRSVLMDNPEDEAAKTQMDAAKTQKEAAEEAKKAKERTDFTELQKIGGGDFLRGVALPGAATSGFLGDGSAFDNPTFNGLKEFDALQANKGNASATFRLLNERGGPGAQVATRDSEKVDLLTEIRDGIAKITLGEGNIGSTVGSTPSGYNDFVFEP